MAIAAKKKQYKLELSSVLQALDRRDLFFYSGLSDEEKKSYVPLILMRYMSSLTDQSANTAYALIATNDIVNIGFWDLSKHPELQHMQLCVAGLGGKQYRPWMATKRTSSRTGKINQWLESLFPDLNNNELDLIKDSHDLSSWTILVKESGEPDNIVKDLIDAWKKQKA